MATEILTNLSEGKAADFLAVYDKVLISANNIQNKIDTNSAGSFSVTGGIFSKPSIDDLLGLNADNAVVMAKKIDGKLAGFIFGTFGLDNNFEDYSYVPSLLKESQEHNLLELISKHPADVFYITDLVVDPDFQSNGVGTELMKGLNEYVQSKYVKYCLSIIYDVRQRGSNQLLTNKSMKLFKRFDAKILGYLKAKTINLGDYEIEIMPNLVLHKIGSV